VSRVQISIIRFLAVTTLAFASTLGAYRWDEIASRSRFEDSSLTWGRQIVAQAEGLALAHPEGGAGAGLRWAAEELNLGKEPRAYRVGLFEKDGTPSRSPAHSPSLSPSNDQLSGTQANSQEHYGVDPVNGGFDYFKVLDPIAGTGLKVSILRSYAGFLGATRKVSNDLLTLAAGALFLSLFFCISQALIQYFNLTPAAQEQGALRSTILNWVKDARGLLTQLGLHVREMLKEAQKLAVAAASSRDALGQLRDRIHMGLTDLHQGRQALKEADAPATQAEVIALNLVIEAAKLGDHGKHFSRMAEDLHRLVQKVRKITQRNEKVVAGLEVEMEPLATDADLAFHSYDDVFSATQGMDAHIRKTTETLVDQAKLIKSVNSDLQAIQK